MVKIRVLMLSWEYPPHSVGGLAKHVEELSEALVAKDLEIHVLSVGSPDGSRMEKRNGVFVYRIEPYNISAPNFLSWVHQLNFRMVEEAIKLFKQYKTYDLLHAHDWLVGYAGRVLKHAYVTPLLATIHATEAGRNQGLHNDDQRYINSIEWWLTYESWKVIACSEHMRREVKGLFGLPDDKIQVIPNGVDWKKFKAGRYNISFGDGKIIFFVGRLVREKGVQVLLDAAPAILAREPAARFVIAGTGPMEDQLKYQARLMGLEHKVEFLGYIDDATKGALYQQASVAVFPSLYEPFGIVALEAMAAGVPVVVSDTGGMGEIVTHGVNGLKAYPGNAESLAYNILHALQNEVLRQELKKNGKRLIEEVYSWDKIAERTIQVYRQVRDEYLQSPWYKENNVAPGDRPEPGEQEQNYTAPERYSLVERRAGSFSRPERRNWQ